MGNLSGWVNEQVLSLLVQSEWDRQPMSKENEQRLTDYLDGAQAQEIRIAQVYEFVVIRKDDGRYEAFLMDDDSLRGWGDTQYNAIRALVAALEADEVAGGTAARP